MIIGLTVVGTVATFSAGGLVATMFMKQTIASIQPAPVVQPLAPAPVETTVAVAAVEPAPAPEPVPSTADVLKTLLDAQTAAVSRDEVKLYDFVSETESAEQFAAAIPERLRNSVIAALDSGKSVDELTGMVSSAVDLGLIEAPAALSTPDGKPDARAILLSIMKEQEAATGKTYEVASLGVEESEQNPTRNQLYTVEAGDSLAYIALKFYGNTEEYRVIFNANRSKIERPDAIQVGQRLIIPAI